MTATQRYDTWREMRGILQSVFDKYLKPISKETCTLTLAIKLSKHSKSYDFCYFPTNDNAMWPFFFDPKDLDDIISLVRMKMLLAKGLSLKVVKKSTTTGRRAFDYKAEAIVVLERD